MKSRRWRLLSGCVAVAALFAAGAFLWRQPGQPVNILLITLDTTRADRLGCYGSDRELTPRLDALAERGILFERAYAPAPLTLPSHATLLTGLWPPEHGLLTNGQSTLQADIPTAAELLAERGYDTAAFVAAFVLKAKFGLDHGFGVYDDDLSTADPQTDELHRFRDGRIVVDAAASWLDKHLRQQAPAPFFCWVHLYDPHDPYRDHHGEFGDRYADRPYDAEIAYTDRQVGRLLDALERLGITDETLVIVVGDHGESLGEHDERTHGYMLHESTLRVPLIVADPRNSSPPARVSTPTPIIDVFAAMLEAGAASLPESNSSRSLNLAPAGGPVEPRVCYSRTDEPYLQAFWCPLQGLTTDRWRYVRTTRPELYDLKNDPQELENLAEQRPDLLADLERQLSDFERTLELRSGEAVSLSAAERRALESLGYTGGGGGAPASTEDGQPLPDIKDTIGYLNELHRATHLMEERKLDEAVAILEPLAREVPNLLRAPLNLGTCRLRQQDYEDAVVWLKAALEIDPQSDRAHDMLAFSYLRLEKLDLAARHFQQLLALRPDSETGHLFLGEIHQRRGNLPLAMRYYRMVLKINPHNRAARQAIEALAGSMGPPSSGAN